MHSRFNWHFTSLKYDELNCSIHLSINLLQFQGFEHVKKYMQSSIMINSRTFFEELILCIWLSRLSGAHKCQNIFHTCILYFIWIFLWIFDIKLLSLAYIIWDYNLQGLIPTYLNYTLQVIFNFPLWSKLVLL